MKTLSAIAAVASVLACFATGCSASTEEVASDTANVEAGTLVYNHDAPVALAPVGGREADRLMLKLFTKGYRSSMDECSANLTDARIAPSVTGKVAGSFTGKGKNETLYILSVWDCDASHADGFGTSRFVVIDPTVTSDVKVLADAEVPGVGASVNRIVDLDGDRQHELVLTNGYVGQGIVLESASLARFAGNTLVNDAAFEAFGAQIAEKSSLDSPFFFDSCNSGLNDMTISFANVFATRKDGKLSFTEQRGTKACPKE